MELFSDGMTLLYEGIRLGRLRGWTVTDGACYFLDLPVRTKTFIS